MYYRSGNRIRRDLKRSLSINYLFIGLRAARRNDSDTSCFDFDMHHKQQTTLHVKANRCITYFIAARSIRQDEHRITDYSGGFLKAYAVFASVDLRLFRVPDEQIAIDGVVIIHT